MKIRMGFISNSSSSSFIITNNSDKTKDFFDFVIETRKKLADRALEMNESFTLNADKDDTINDILHDLMVPEVELSLMGMMWPGTIFQFNLSDESGIKYEGIYRYLMLANDEINGWSWGCVYNSQTDLQ